MGDNLKATIQKICAEVNNNRSRLMDVVDQVQRQFRGVSYEAMEIIGEALHAPPVEIQGLVSFYAFFSEEPKGKIIIRVCNDVIDRMMGMEEIARAFSEELELDFGQTSDDAEFSLEYTPCIGMCDQAPAALINDEVITRLTPERAREIVRELKQHGDPKQLITNLGDGHNRHDLVRAMVTNGIRKKGPVIFASREEEVGLKRALILTPEAVIQEVKRSGLRGRGGAGFPTGMKWEFTRGTRAEKRFLFCNADEGEPGTFKDRVLLTECYEMLFEGMTIGGYAIGAEEGIIYLRGEYYYLRKFLETMIAERRQKNLLGKNILGKDGFCFDIRIQMGAGAYICGEESALLSSCEGLRGDPKTRPPFPAQKGYLGYPTSVNNVETLCCVARILEMKPDWFLWFGSKKSPGIKLLSVSGDCRHPGVYEFRLGVPIREILAEVGAENAQAVLVGGPSGPFIGPDSFDRTICYDDLGTGGALVIFGPDRDLLSIANQYMEFFIEESCGYCTPCRVGNPLLKAGLEKILIGNGEATDLAYLEDLGRTVKKTSRCGLGQTSPNPILTTLKNFRPLYEERVKKNETGLQPTFSIHRALKESEEITDRKSEIFK